MKRTIIILLLINCFIINAQKVKISPNGKVLSTNGSFFNVIPDTNTHIPIPPEPSIPPSELFGYFVSPTGNDSYSGTSVDSAWETPLKVETEIVAGTINSGDSVFFERNGRFDLEETFNISDTNIYFGAYGTGNKPILTGLTSLNQTWISKGGNLWKARLIETEVNYVFKNGVKILRGRSPNDTNLYHMDSTAFEDRIAMGTLNLPNNTIDTATFIGATSAEWVFHTSLIERQENDTIHLSSAASYNFNGMMGYLIVNHPWTLDLQDEWCYNTYEDSITIYSTTDPNLDVFEYSAQDLLMYVYNSDTIKFENIEFLGANQTAIQVDNSTDIHIDSCMFSNMPEGIEGVYMDYGRIKRNTLRDISNFGIRVRGSYDVEIDSNRLTNIASEIVEIDDEPYGLSMNGIGTTYQVSSANYGEAVYIRHNVIDTVGYRGIDITTTNKYYISHNYVTNACYLKLDGGAYYAWHNSGLTMPVFDWGYFGYNFADKGQTGYALSFKDPRDNSSYTSFAGYFDDGNSKATLEYNFMKGHRHGFYFHNTDSIGLFNNVSVGNQLYALRLRDDGILSTKDNTNYTLYKNRLIVNPLNDQLCYTIWAQGNPVPFTVNYLSDSNHLVLISDQYNPFYERDLVYWSDGGGSDDFLTIEEYQSQFGGPQDKGTPFTYDLTELTTPDSMVFAGMNYSDTNYVVSNDFPEGYYVYSLDSNIVVVDTISPWESYVYLLSKTTSVFAPDTAQSFNAISNGKDSLSLSASGFDLNTDSVRILYAYDSYPADRTDGTLLYAGDTNITEEYYIDVAQDTTVYVSMFSGSSNDLWSSANQDTAQIDSTGFTAVTIFENYFTDSTEWVYTQGLWRFDYTAGDSTAQFLDVSTTPLRYNMSLPANTNLKFTFEISVANTTARFAFTDNSEVVIVNYDNYAVGTHEVYGTTDANGGTSIMIYGSSGSPDVWNITYLKIETQ